MPVPFCSKYRLPKLAIFGSLVELSIGYYYYDYFSSYLGLLMTTLRFIRFNQYFPFVMDFLKYGFLFYGPGFLIAVCDLFGGFQALSSYLLLMVCIRERWIPSTSLLLFFDRP